jgi:hypothetical protein
MWTDQSDGVWRRRGLWQRLTSVVLNRKEACLRGCKNDGEAVVIYFSNSPVINTLHEWNCFDLRILKVFDFLNIYWRKKDLAQSVFIAKLFHSCIVYVFFHDIRSVSLVYIACKSSVDEMNGSVFHDNRKKETNKLERKYENIRNVGYTFTRRSCDIEIRRTSGNSRWIKSAPALSAWYRHSIRTHR